MDVVPSKRLQEYVQFYMRDLRRLWLEPRGYGTESSAVFTRNTLLDLLREEHGLEREAGIKVLGWLCAKPELPVGEIIDRVAAGELPPRSPSTVPGREAGPIQAIADALRKAEASGSPIIGGPAIAGVLETMLTAAISDAYGVSAGTARRAVASVTGPDTPGWGNSRSRSVFSTVRRIFADNQEAAAGQGPAPGNKLTETEAAVHGGHYMVTRYTMPPYEIIRPGYLGGQKSSCACGNDTCPHAAGGTARISAARALYRQGWTADDITAALSRTPAEHSPGPVSPGKRPAVHPAPSGVVRHRNQR